MRVKYFVLWGLLLCSPSTVSGKDPGILTTPDLELLEFLGTWETNDGQWINPLELSEPSMSGRQTGSVSPDKEDIGMEGETPKTQDDGYENDANTPSFSPGRDVHE